MNAPTVFLTLLSRASRALWRTCVLGGLVAAPAAANDAPLLHAMFQDHAVVQRDQPIRIWGQTRPGEEVRVVFGDRSARGRADAAGNWEAVVPAMKAGGPHRLTASSSGGATQTVDDVLVGEVWLCSGQSNMVLQVHRSLDARAEIADGNNARIRMLTVSETSHAVPLKTFAAPVQWHKTTPETVREFSAACYYFARELQKKVDVPMGLISAAWGGSRIEAWTSGQALRAAGFGEELDVLALYVNDPTTAAERWGEIWRKWWHDRASADAADEPWRLDYIPGAEWRRAPAGLGAWERWGMPDLAEFNGMVWYRTSVKLTGAQASQDAVLVLGAVDEMDMTWVNGRAVGSSYGAGNGREYRLPRGLLREGDNAVVINVLDTYREGGIAGPASAYALQLQDGTRVPLQPAWIFRRVPGTQWPPFAPWHSASGLSTLYNGMIAPIGRYGLRGIAWYQGESNTGEAGDYLSQLRTLRNDWRARFGERTPMLIVQLAGYGTPPTQPGDSGWAALREAQRQAAAEDARTGLAVAIDIGDRYDIHPPNKQELGRRLARAARQVVYGERLPPSGPVPQSVRREGQAVVVSFGDVTERLVAYGADGPIGFELCGGPSGSCRYASATIHGNEVTLRATNAAAATRIRYGWADSPVVTLFDGAGLPAGPFEMPLP